MALLANMSLFFVIFLPLTFLVGAAGDFYVGRYQQPEDASPLFYWMVVAWPLLIPSILFVPVAHLALALARRGRPEVDRDALRRLSTVAFPLGMLAVHTLLWGGVVLSIPLLLSFLIPGAIYGWLARIPEPRPAGGHSRFRFLPK